MDYHTLQRRQLQTLCKKHGIPANAANSEMADALTALLKPKPQLHADNSKKQPEKRATRSREPALSEIVSKIKDVEEESNTKLQKTTNSIKILEEESNRKPQRVTRGRGSARAVVEEPKSAAMKTEKTPTNGETERNSATKQQEAKKVGTRNGASKQTNSKMRANAEDKVDSKLVSPKSDKKKEKAGGIVLRRGKVKVRSPGNLSKSPESEKIIKPVAVTTEEKGPCSQLCLVDAKKTRKKKKSVTFSDVLEVNSACAPAKGTMAEIPLGADPHLPKNTNSACIARKVVGTRKASRSVLTKDCVQDVIAAQADHQESSKEPVSKVDKAEGLHVVDAEKTANIEIGGESDGKKSVQGKKILKSVGEAAAIENEEKVADGLVKGNQTEDVPCTRRSRRLTIVPTDVKSNQNIQLPTDQLKGQSKDLHEGSSVAPKKTEGALPADISRRSRRKTLAPLELNHVQSNVGSASEQVEKRVSKAKDTQSKGYASESKDEVLESHSEIKTCDSTPVAIEAEVQPFKAKEALSVSNSRANRRKALVAYTYQHITPTEELLNEMGYQNMCTMEIISGKLEKNVNTAESEKDHSQAPLSTSILANSETHSLQEVSNDAKVEVEIVRTTSVMPSSTRKTSEVSTHPDNGTAVSQEPAFNTQSNIVKQEGLVFMDEAVGKNIQDSEDLDVIAQAYIEESLVLKNTNELSVEDPVNNTPSINRSDRFSSAFQIVTGKGEGQNQINSEDANSISCNEEFEYNTCSIDVISPSTTATHSATSDSETTNSSSPVDKPDATDVKCHEFTGETSSATSSECVHQGHEFTFDKDHAMDELATIISLTEDTNEKSRSDSPVPIRIQDNGSLDGNHHMKGTNFENSIVVHTDESSAAAIVESTFKHQSPIDMATAEQEPWMPMTSGGTGDLVHHMKGTDLENSIVIYTDESSAAAIVESTFEHRSPIDMATAEQESWMPMTSGGAGDLVEQQPNHTVDLNLCEEEDAVDKEEMKIHGGLQKEQLQDSVGDRSTKDDQLGQLSPLLPSCSVEPGIALPRESACKTKQKWPRSIYKSARKAEFSVAWENGRLEENTAPPPNKEDSLNSLDQAEKDAEIWGLNSHEMSCDEVNSASSEEEESSSETEETLSDTEVCNFNTEVLSSNTKGDYSCSEDDTPSDTEEDTMFDSEDDFLEMEGELLSDDECYESEELDTSEEELSESEDDAEDHFEEYEVSPMSQSVANSESFNALYTTHGLEDQQVEIIAATKSSLPNNEVTEAEIMNCVAFENVINGCACNVDPTDIDEKVGGQHEELQKTLSTHDAATEIQENVDVLMSCKGNTAMEGQDSNSCTFLSSLFASPPSKVKEDVKCSSVPPSIGILEFNVSQQSGNLDTELNILLESGQEESTQFCFPCDISHEDVLAEVEQHTVKSLVSQAMASKTIEVEHCSTPKCSKDSCAALKNVINGCASNVDPQDIDEKVGRQHEELQKTLSTHAATEIQENVDVLMVCKGNTAMERLQSTTDSTCQDSDLLTFLSSLFASPPSKVEEDVKCSLAPPPIGILESTVSQQSGNLETELNILQESGQEESIQLCFPCELSREDLVAEVEQHTVENLVSQVMASNTIEVDHCSTPKCSKDSDVARVFNHESLNETMHCGVNEIESVNAEVEEVHEELQKTLSTHAATEIQENVDVLMSCKGNTAMERVQSTTDSTCQDSDLLTFLSFLFASPPSKVKEDIKSSLAPPSIGILESNVSQQSGNLETELKILQESGQEESIQLCFPSELSHDHLVAEVEEHTVESLVSQVMASNTIEVDHCSTPKCSKDSGIAQVFNHESLNEVSQTMHCVEIESVNAQVEEVHEKPLDESQASEESKEDKETAAANNLISEISKEQSMKQIMHCVGIESVNAQVGEVHEKPLDESQESKEDKETAAENSLISEISKEQSMKQIDLTLLSVRKLRQMCKGSQMSPKKKTENETPAKKSSNLWMSATKQVHQPNTSKHPRDLPSASKRSALQALSSNVKATPSAAMQTPTAKVLQRPRNLMGTYDGNEGTGKHLVTPSPQAPMSSKRDFARSHHR